MRVQHINSKEIFDISTPKYIKYSDSTYGYLVGSHDDIFYISGEVCQDVSNEYYEVF